MSKDVRVNVTMRYSESELAGLNAVAKFHGLERADAVRMLIAHELRRLAEQHGVPAPNTKAPARTAAQTTSPRARKAAKK